ncbi:MAG: hypothetical protein SFZ24_06620 [Planctomycetota bacterium]|nr:hypothetical protein [Planctomycetota bacterium]
MALSAIRLSPSAALLLLAGVAGAGDLTPPAGPIIPTMKTLQEVEPRIALSQTTTPGDNDSSPSIFKITQPGTYYLTESLVVPAGVIAVEIDSSYVTLDLNGFTIFGGSVGVGVFGTRLSVTVENGVIHSSGGALEMGPASSSTVRSLVVRSNSVGVRLGAGGNIENCQIDNNIIGVRFLGGAQIVRDTIVAANISVNIDADNSGYQDFRFSNIQSIGNAVSLPTAKGVVVTDSHFESSGGTLLSVGDNAQISGSRFQNGGTGLRAGWNVQLVGNAIFDCDTGLQVVGSGGLIENNYLVSNATGINITGVDNLVIRNRVRLGNVRFNIVNGNRVASIAAAGIAGTINGSAGGGQSSTDPLANLAY